LLGLIIKSEIGGVTLYNINLFKKLKKKNIDVKLIVLSSSKVNNNIFTDFSFDIGLDFLYFEYNELFNLYHISKKFAGFIRLHGLTSLIANDSFEIQMLQISKSKIKTIFILHGDYSHYYNTALENRGIIDLFVCVSRQIRNKLLMYNGQLNTEVLGPVVKRPNGIIIKKSTPLVITFIGRPDESKGFPIIMELIKRSQDKVAKISWNIITGGENIKHREFVNVNYYCNVDNKLVRKLLGESHIFILPSKAEGFPISLVEALFHENICITSDLDVFQDIIQNNELGFAVSAEEIESYWNHIMIFLESIEVRNKFLSRVRNFDFKDYLYNEQSLQRLIESIECENKATDFSYQQLGILDKKYVPNCITYFTRKYVR
jgi:glycosyltransferase involved in cell wall biosynthesis